MNKDAEESLLRWETAGLIDALAADRIRAWDLTLKPTGSVRWGAAIAWGLGALLIGSGVISFVAANWNEISPLSRILLILILTTGFHFAAGMAEKMPALRLALHGVGTACLGAGIALIAQVFHLSGRWNGWMLLWAIGAAAGYWLIRDWLQLLLVAVLVPLWMSAEWEVRLPSREDDLPHVCFWLGLLVLYFLSRYRPLMWLGAIGLLPATIVLFLLGLFSNRSIHPPVASAYWALAVVVLLLSGLAWKIFDGFHAKGFGTVAAVVAVSWSAAAVGGWAMYPVVAIAYGAMIWWGVAEQRVELVNIGVAGFALTVFSFYVSHALSLLGSSIGLIASGLLLFGGGFALEKARRHLLVKTAEGAA